MFGSSGFLLKSKSLYQKIFCIFSLFVICLPARFVHSQDVPKKSDATPLETGRRIERELAGGEKHAYKLALGEGQHASLIIEQRGIDVAARVFGADGKLIFEFDEEARTQGREKIEITAGTTGDYRIEVEARLKNAAASRYDIEFQEMRPATERDRLLQEARLLFTESLSLSRAGKYKDALPLVLRALEIGEKNAGAEDSLIAPYLIRTGVLNFDLGDTAAAEKLFTRALSIYEKQTEPDDLKIAAVLNNLSVLYRNRGEYAEALAMLLRALELRENALGTNHTLVAGTLNNLGILYRRRGDNANAEKMYERSLEIRSRIFGENHIDLTATLQNLAALNYYKGDYATALKLDLRVLEIYEKNYGPDHPDVAQALSNLALVYADGGEPEKAEPLYLRALEIREKRFGRDHVSSSPTLHNLAKLYFQKADYARAKPLFERALQLADKNYESNPLTVAQYLNSLGNLYVVEGAFEKAEPLLKRALEISERISGVDHQTVGRAADSLAQLYALKGEAEKAVAFQARANRINEKNAALNLALGSEHQKLAYMNLLSESMNQTIDLHANLARGNEVAREQAVTVILQRKGRVLDAMANSLAALRRRADARDQSLFEELNVVNTRLADLTLNEPGKTAPDEYQKQIASIREQKDKLEGEVSRRSAGFYENSQPVTLSAVQKAVPHDHALVEFAVYRPQISEKAMERKSYGEPRYIAYVIQSQGEVRWKELGEAAQINATVADYRLALRDPKRKDVQALARKVDEKIMQPVRALLGDAKKLLISPDGALNLIPFEALVDERGKYLVEDYSFAYLTSGRDLLRMQTPRESKSNPLIIANPTFGNPEAESETQTAQTKTNARRSQRRSTTAARDLSGVYFAQLFSTEQEARSIRELFPEAEFLSGSRASETALKQMPAPRILHIATHGFFLQNAARPEIRTRGLSAAVKHENPLLRSGLAFAGANQRRAAGGDDGILTALEASGLNLWGTKLVVLSACDTGLGEVRDGEGVYGLRRAFVLAGAESMVMSLWSVSDYVTRELMTGYYKNLKQEMGRGAALRQVQLEMLKKSSRRHPFYWASFIQSGDWRNLDGRR